MDGFLFFFLFSSPSFLFLLREYSLVQNTQTYDSSKSLFSSKRVTDVKPASSRLSAVSAPAIPPPITATNQERERKRNLSSASVYPLLQPFGRHTPKSRLMMADRNASVPTEGAFL